MSDEENEWGGIRITQEPFLLVPRWVYESLMGEQMAFMVYGALANRANEQRDSWPGIARIAEEIGYSESAVKRAIGVLKTKGIIEVTTRKLPHGGWGANLYHLPASPPLVQPETPGVGSPVNPGGSTSELRSRTKEVEPEVRPSVVPTSGGIRSSSSSKRSSYSPTSTSIEGPRTPATARPDVEAVVILLATHVANITNRVATIGATWRRDIRLMLDNDGVYQVEAEAIIRWLGSNDQRAQFWATNILSPKKLRQHFPRLVLERTKGKGSAHPAKESLQNWYLEAKAREEQA